MTGEEDMLKSGSEGNEKRKGVAEQWDEQQLRKRGEVSDQRKAED